jgi:hypothetical protein
MLLYYRIFVYRDIGTFFIMQYGYLSVEFGTLDRRMNITKIKVKWIL